MTLKPHVDDCRKCDHARLKWVTGFNQYAVDCKSSITKSYGYEKVGLTITENSSGEIPVPLDKCPLLKIKDCPFCHKPRVVKDIADRMGDYNDPPQYTLACETKDCFLEWGGGWYYDPHEALEAGNKGL